MLYVKKIWNADNKYAITDKTVSFKLGQTLDCKAAELFKHYLSITYPSPVRYIDSNNSWEILKQKINNIYSTLCDVNVCCNRDYIKCFYVPKHCYFEYVKKENINLDCLKRQIDKSLKQREVLFEKYTKSKINITWDDYKRLINTFLFKIMNNYIPIDEFENESSLVINITYWSEDNYVIKYIGNSLKGYMKNYQKEYFGVKRGNKKGYTYCAVCGKMVAKTGSRTKYCSDCSVIQTRKKQNARLKKWRLSKKETV